MLFLHFLYTFLVISPMELGIMIKINLFRNDVSFISFRVAIGL
ncbi:hypothetical protein DSUL_90033 [Desulfovibrionales bacterium]